MKKVIFKKDENFVSEWGGNIHSDESYYAPKGIMTKEQARKEVVNWLGISMDTYRYQVDEGNEDLIKQVERLIEQGFQVVEPIIKITDNVPQGYIEVPIRKKYFSLMQEIHEKPALMKKMEPSPEEIKEMMKELFG